MYLALSGALCKTIFAILGLNSARSFIISIKLPLFFDSGFSSWPLKAQDWDVRHLTAAIVVWAVDDSYPSPDYLSP